MIKYLQCLLLIVFLYAESSAQSKIKRTPSTLFFPLKVFIENRVDTQLLSLDSAYVNSHGEDFIVRNFRYYISHLSVTDSKGKEWPLPPAWFLIDERKPESKIISVQIPVSKIISVSFFIGVDSAKNVSGTQTGSLDPANGMFWTWNSGYIFAKLEGTSTVSSAPQHGFTYHIGGFRSGENALRKVTLSLPQLINIPLNKNKSITLIANVNAWFAGSSSITISEQPFTMNPGKLAMQIADNYAGMFTVK